MVELLDTQPDLQVQDAEYQRLLGFPPHHAMDGRARELAERSRQWYAQYGKPWIYAREAAGFELDAGTLRINGTPFASKRLHDQLSQAQADKAVLALVSAGQECEERARELWQEEKPDEYFFMEVYGSAVVEHLITVAGARLCAFAEPKGMAVLPHYSPGYPGWEVADQVTLFELLRQNGGRDFPGEIRVRETGMLQPKKSLLALFGITKHSERVRNIRTLSPCENCSYPTCQYRRTPFKESLLQFEDVRRLQPVIPSATPERAARRSALDPNAKYSINARALRKWSEERLKWKCLADRTIEAQFRYEGTTCSNLGRPLEFHYRVTLGPPDGGFKIMHAECRPADGDTGHKEMCAYLDNPQNIMGSIAGEKPLLGRPLNDVLAWAHPSSPAGCYCDAASRAHKWGLVFEVIHYALVEHEKNMESE